MQRILNATSEAELKIVLEELYARDQSTLSRDAAASNLRILEDERLESMVDKISLEAKDTYYFSVSFFRFHVAQKMMYEYQDAKGLECFEGVLHSMEKNSLDSKSAQEWHAYVHGTVFYLKRKIIPQEVLNEAKGRQLEILQHFNETTKLGIVPRYVYDYER